jgi:stress response protein SCP2
MGIELIKGGRFNLSKEVPSLKQLAVSLGWQVSIPGKSYDIDASVFMLGLDGKVPEEKYFVFYNNLQSLDSSVKHSGDSRNGKQEGDVETIYIDLAKANADIHQIVFVVTIHEANEKNQNFSQVNSAFIRIYDRDSGKEITRYLLNEKFSNETALEFGRLYKKDGEWRFQAAGQGYNAGLQTFVDKYLVESKQEEKKEEPQVKVPEASFKNQKSILLEKKLEQEAPHIFNLVKKADISLQKVNLTNHKAKVALCLDISGSMSFLYSSGKIQLFAEKILALGCRFDDNASIDIFLFGTNAHKAGEMTIDSFKSFIPNMLKHYPLEGGTCYGKVIKMIRKFYFPYGRGESRKSPSISNQPVYVMFVTDGATIDESETEQHLKWSSYEPIFWQFMAIGKSKKDVKGKGLAGWLSQAFTSDFTFLEKLDTMRDRYVDNANFFSTEDPKNIADQDLYDLLMTEYPSWVQVAQAKQLLRLSQS